MSGPSLGLYPSNTHFNMGDQLVPGVRVQYCKYVSPGPPLSDGASDVVFDALGALVVCDAILSDGFLRRKVTATFARCSKLS